MNQKNIPKMNEDNINLEARVGEEILVHLKGSRRIEGTLLKFDEYMNLVLGDAKILEHGGTERERELMIIKGGNVQTIVG